MMDPFFTSAVKVKPRKRRRSYRLQFKFPDRRKPVICIETGERFESAAAAGRSVKADRNGISNSIAKGGRCHGFHWKYEEVSE